MSSDFNFSYNFRKYPLLRILLLVLLVVIVVAVFYFATTEKQQLPIIYSIDPPVGSAGEVLSISGSGFGESRNNSYVEIGGSRLTISSYILWSGDLIKVVLPQTVQDGLVSVVTKAGKSEPKVFANKAAVPVAVPPDPQTAIPKIISVSKTSAFIGEMLTITGENFGSLRNNSIVYFSTANDSSSQIVSTQGRNKIQCSISDYDYEFWSNQEIKVRVPDGAVSGSLSIETEKGESNLIKINIDTPVGSKNYNDKHSYIVNLSVDIDNVVVDEESILTLRVPYPPESAMQRSVEMTSCTPSPVLSDYLNTIVHQLALEKVVDEKQQVPFLKKTFAHTFVITAYSVKTDIKSKQVMPFTDTSRLVYTVNTRSDFFIKSDDETVIALAKEITGKETNPYIKAKKIYDYMLDNYFLLEESRGGNASPLDVMNSKTGDAYDFTVLYCTLLRAAGIPSLPVSGILINSELKTQVHWWTEFYLEKLGWIPVDIALGAGMQYASFKPATSPKDFYFGNMDGQHIAFSRGWNEVKPAFLKSKTVYRPKTYAMQSIWEESTVGISSYSSFWSDISVTGVY